MSRGGKMGLLRERGKLTKFQILYEIMRKQPHVTQKEISEVLGITVQAVSKHFKALMSKGLVEAGSDRARYRLTANALEKLREETRQLDRYITKIKNDLKVGRVWPAMAKKLVKVGDEVGLVMRDGVSYAVDPKHPDAEAMGRVSTDASPGEDVGIDDLRGTVKLSQGRILIIKLPRMEEGGSRVVDIPKVQRLYEEFKPDRIGVMGTVGRGVLNKLGLKPDLEFGISRATALAALRGVNVLVLVVGRMVSRMIDEIDSVSVNRSVEISYEVKDGRIL